MNKQTNRNKITAGRLKNYAKDCKASLELARVCIDIANLGICSTVSLIFLAMECMVVVRATHCIRTTEKERYTKCP